MKSKFKSVVSLFLTVIMIFGITPIASFVGVDLPEYLESDGIIAKAATLTLNELKNKYPEGKYWNHVGSSNNNPNGWTNSPCPSHSSTSTCNAFVYNGSEIGWQCFGFALQLGYDAYGSNPKSWGRAYDLDNIKPGDIINYNGEGHTVFVIDVSGDTVTFAECNYGSRCIISWKRCLKKSQFNNLLNVYVAPYALDNSSVHSHNYNGEGNEELHPHKIYRICSCGDWYYTGETTKRSDCLACYPPTLSVYFNANGGSISSDTYKLSSNLIYNKSDSTKYFQKWTYNNTKENGLVNYSTFGIYRTGFKFVGWGTKPSGGTVFSQSDNTLKPSDINPNIVNGSCSITLYAQWESKGNYVDVWVSTKGKDYQYTECPEISQGIVQNKYYFWFKLANSESNELYNTYANSNYKSIISVYNPDGSLLYSAEYNKSDNNWIGATPTQIGKYKVNIKITGDVTANYSEYFTVKSDGKVTLTPSTLTLDLKSSPSKTVEIGLSGNWPDGATYSIKTTNSNISQANSGRTITVTAKKKGTSKLYVDILDNDGNVITSATTNVTVTAPEYNVTYNVNGGSGAPSSQIKIYGTALTLSSTKPTRKGYTFVNWNTKADGTGKSYAAGASYTSNAAVTLYAQWKANTYTIAFNGNGSTSGSMSNLSMTYDVAKNLTANAYTKTGYTFNGWNTKADGSGTSYANKASVKNLTSTNGGTVTLYAIWQKNAVNSYTLTYNANGGSGAPSAQSGATSYTISSTKPTKSGYLFLGWSKSSTATTASYTSGDTISISANTTLYAVWQKKPVVTYTLTYNANGGSGAPSAQSGATSYTISSTKPTKSGYLFLGWSESKTATMASYTSGDSITLTSDTTLYAVWFRIPDLTTTEVVIRKPSIVALSYGDSLILHADLSKDLPVGWRIEWTADNGNFKFTVSDDGTTCTITPKNSGSTSFTSTIYDAYGNEISKDTQVMSSKAGFFDKLIAFFKKLFGLTKVIQQSIDTIY